MNKSYFNIKTLIFHRLAPTPTKRHTKHPTSAVCNYTFSDTQYFIWPTGHCFSIHVNAKEKINFPNEKRNIIIHYWISRMLKSNKTTGVNINRCFTWGNYFKTLFSNADF